MGRIAEALKKAEQERLARSGGTNEGGIAVLSPPSLGRVGIPGMVSPIDDARKTTEPAALVEGMSESLVSYYDRSSLISEQYRALRTRLISHNQQSEHRVLAITSSAPKDGKTVTAVNLAVTIAEIRHFSTLVVDADFRRSSLADIFNLRSSPGLADLLAGEATYPEIIQKTPIPNMHFVAAGELKGRNATELLSAMTTRAAFRWFESQYHFTVVDTPPVTTVTDVGIIGPLCSGVIMVVRMNQTPEPLAKRAVRLLQVNSIPIVGCVLVGHDERGAGYGYRYNYYHYYDYTKNDEE